MHIGSIQLIEFRNYRTLSYTPSPRLNLLTGPNAQGKTNLLEALAFLLVGRSFRTSRLGDLARWGESSAAVSGELRRQDTSRTIRRTVRMLEDSRWQAAGESCPWARVIVFGWQDLSILTGMPAARRAFIDGVAGRIYPSHLPALGRYRQVLARRNLLLRTRPGEAALAPWDEQLAAVGTELIDRRRRATAMLQTELARIYPAVSGERHKTEIRYRTELGEATEPAALLAAIARVRRDEIRRGQSLVGPHRDDLVLELDGIDARVFGSRGQQRLLALSLRLAEVLPVREAAGTTPVLLLDDALSELDGTVRGHVLREIQTAEQVFLTAPEPLRVEGAARWDLRAGGLCAA
ncbi:MAG: DNA replication and repair protein RecF [Candidatus Rokubacteria bacterium]|nr:DNA replication and repair protein RecF [Candidatus Rokubacteria bacterium]